MKLSVSVCLCFLSTLFLVPVAKAQPANNHFTNAWVLSGTFTSTNGNTSQPSNATKEPGEPNHGGLVGGRSVWFTWTAPTNGPVRISTAGSAFNTLLGVYVGASVNALSLVASNDNFGGQGNTSRVDFNAQPGTNYWIAVDGRSNGGGAASSGAYTLTLLMLGSAAITSPTNGSLIIAGTPIPVSAQVTTPNPPIVRVDFYRAGSVFASLTEPPFLSTFTNPPLGTNAFLAVAVDGAGLNWTSAVASVLVQNLGVTITSPADGAVLLNTNPITVAATALLPAGAITNVEFFVDGVEFAARTAPPFNAVWNAVTPGVHRLTAIGHGDDGSGYVSGPVLIAVAELLIRTNAVWKYLDNGSDPGTNWAASTFDDSAWTNGPAEFGYGDGDEATVVSFGTNANAKFTTTYFRHSFSVANPAAYTNLALRLRRDDGAVVYCNGVEVGRFNMPTGAVNFATFASSVASDDGDTFQAGNVSPGFLVTGMNVVAAEIHQSDLSSSDVSFDLDLLGVPAVPREAAPRLLAVLPTPGEVFHLTNVTVTFTKPVSGVDASDLLVNGAPAGGLTGVNPTTYRFQFERPAFGIVRFTWAADHGITDEEAVPNPFDATAAGSTFQFSFLNPDAPTVAASVPPAGAIVTNLTQILVTFSTAVTNVDAGDFLINGTPATGVSGEGAAHTFTFPQPPYGPLAIRWATNHGIQDLASPANEFDPTRPGGVWNYTHVDPVPSVTLTAPTNGAVYVTPTNLTLQALAGDGDGVIAQVEFFAGTNRLGADTNAPFAFTWVNVPPGSYTLSAVATDNSGLSATSAPVDVTVVFGATALILSGSTWKYLDTGADLSNAWPAVAFDDSGWASGPSELGYGDSSDGRPEATVIGFGTNANNKYVTSYFRHAFEVADLGAISNLTLRLRRDDGAVVYLNGTELFRDNMPTGDVTYVTLATTNVLGNDEHRFIPRSVDPARLVTGLNLLAVEVHQSTANSADLSFDLELLINLPPEPPSITLTSPTNNATFQAPLNLALQAAASDNDGSVARVDFFVGTNLLEAAAQAPFTVTWTNPPAGSHTLFAMATDNTGLTATSAPARITVIAGPTPLVLTGAVWRFLDDGSDQGTGWRQLEYDDAGWRAGPAQFGYGDSDEATVVGFGPDATNKFVTTYFRHHFVVTDPSAFVSLTLDLLRDDGAVVYLNGVEAHRNNVPAGAVTFRTLAFNGSADEDNFLRAVLPPSLLVSGTNLLAVEIHQDDVTSSDISFDLRLTGATGGLPLAVTRGPYLQIGTPTSGTVRWRTDLASDAVVFYGSDPTNLAAVAFQAALTNEHIVTLNGLSPDTTYYYAVGSSTRILAGGTNYWFATAPVPGTNKPTRLWVLGDSGTANQNARNVRDAYYQFAAATRPANLWLMLGDNAYDSGTDTEHQRAVFDLYPATLRNLFLWPTIGNHETGQSQTVTDFPYLHIFSLPQNGEAGGLPSGTEKYYSFDYANIHLVCLDSMTSGRGTNTAMARWLVDDLAATAQDWIIVFFHHPPYTKGNHNSDTETELIEMRQNILPILEAGGVDLVLSGHSHAWERSFLLHGHYGNSSTLSASMKVDGGNGREEGTGVYRKNAFGEGVVYTVAGNGGQITGGSLNHAAHFLSLNELGSMVIDVVSNRLDAIFLATNGVIRDQFTLVKPPAGAPHAPANLTARSISANDIALTWRDLATNELGYLVERSLDGTNFTTLTLLAPNTTNLLDSGLTTGLTYFYRVQATNDAGLSDFSNLASATLVPGGTVPAAPSFLVAAADNGSDHFRSQVFLRWRDNSSNETGFAIERTADGEDFTEVATVGANATHYVDRGLESATAYFYRVRSLHPAGASAPSNLAAETTHPQSQLLEVGGTVTFHGGVEGTPPVRYQWRYQGAPISGETNESLTLTQVQAFDEGSYSVTITDADRRVTSNPAMLFVLAPPLIVGHPASRTNTLGSTATFTVAALGTEPLTYQWRHQGVEVPGATEATLTLTAVSAADAGVYTVEVRNDFGTALSLPAFLAFNTPPFAAPDTVTRLPDEPVVIEIARLLANDGDADGDPVGLVSVVTNTTQGGTVSITGRYVLYSPPPGHNGDDTFIYLVSDGRGGFAQGIVTVVVSDNTPPALAAIPDYFVNVLQLLVVTNIANDAETPTDLTASLGFGAPTNAHIHPRTGRLTWRPTREQAPGTNRITVIMTDAGAPPLLDAKTFTVIVNDYYELTVGAAAVRAGQSASVPLELYASAGLTRVRCTLQFNPNTLANFSLEPLHAAVGTATLAPAGPDALVLDLIAALGQSFQGTQTLARLQFTAASGQASAFVPLTVTDVQGEALDSFRSPSALVNSGRVTIIADKPLLEAGFTSEGERVLLLYGQPGAAYWIERAPSPEPGAVWTPWRSITLTDVPHAVTDLGAGEQSVFFRLRQ